MKTKPKPTCAGRKVTWKQLTVRLPVEVHRALKVQVAREGRHMGQLIEELVRQWLVGVKKA